jgi:cyclic-di-AMP phosphodiesterase PgpH
MLAWLAGLLEKYLKFPYDQTLVVLQRLAVAMAAAFFILVATVIVGFDDIFPGQGGITTLQVADIAPDNIYAPESRTYISQVLTDQRRESAMAAVRPVYDPPDPSVARQQIDLARQILDYIENIRRDPFGSAEQKMRDLSQIAALTLGETTIRNILELDHETWQEVDNQIIVVLERVMRGEIQEVDLAPIRAQLPTQVSPRFDEREAGIIVTIISELLRPNTRLNEEATTAARQAAAEAVVDETRSFERGQIVVAGGTRITPLDYEALDQLGILRMEDRRLQGMGQSLLASIVVMVVMGLYISRFQSSLLYQEPRFLALLAAIFLIVLFGARLGLSGQIYIYPTAALALLFVAITGAEIAIIGVLGLSFLVGLMASNSLEIAALVAVSGIIGALTLRRAERLNSFFFAGLMVAASNVAVATLFNLGTPAVSNSAALALLVIYSLLNGILTAAAAIAGLYIVTLVFNLPTALKLVELSQPNQPLLQRLLREAPGSYQHTLQVANLAEQAANAIGANAELTHVAALYHDIGKMLTPAFFTENQQDINNPHDTLNDPYRSADIIIGHVTGGDELARQYRLPNRIRDFIREHHGTSQVYVFYQQAIILAGNDESQVDISDFTYPGPRPQSRETAVLMLADSCEAAIRSMQPGSRAEIEKIVQDVIDGKRRAGQLDESGLTLNDLKVIHNIFVEMLQAVFHPRINYQQAIARVTRPVERGAASSEPEAAAPPAEAASQKPPSPGKSRKSAAPAAKPENGEELPAARTTARKTPIITEDQDDDGAPLAEVPRLRRTGENRAAEDGETSEGETEDEGAEKPEPDPEQRSE